MRLERACDRVVGLPHSGCKAALRLRSVTALISVLACLAAQAGDWRMFRGQNCNGSGEETDLPAHLEAGKSLAWQVSLPGRGVSSPIIVGDKVFVTCASGPRQERLHVICFAASTGAKQWERVFRATGRTMCHEKTSVAAPTPASDGERVYALFSCNDLVCLDLEGNLLWLRGLTLDYPNASNSIGLASSLAVAAGILLVQSENDSESLALGLDAETGINRWKLDRPKLANWTSPVVLANAAGGSMAALQSGRGLTLLELGSGQAVWNYTNGAATIASSAVGQDVLYVPSQGLTALAVQSEAGQPRQLWSSSQLRPGTASPAVLSGRVYVLNEAGVLTCGAAADGRRLWQLRLKGPFAATPVGAGQHLYCVNEKGLLQVVNTAKPEGEVLSELDLGQTILATPALAHGGLYLRSDRTLWRTAEKVQKRD
jgi:outer membrane protein assembly factor BamB